MALQKQTISFPMLKGSDEKTSLPASQPGGVESAKNVVFNKTGEVQKRHGFENFRNSSGTVGDQSSPFSGIVTSSTNTKRGVRLHKFKDSLLMADGQMLYNKVGASNMKPVEFLLDCTYANNSVFTPSNKKVSQVNVIRKTLSSVDYDIIVYVETTPARAASGDTFEIMMAVREVASGAFYRAPTSIGSFARATNGGFYQEVSTLPSVHLTEDSSSKVYVIASHTTNSGGAVKIKAKRFDFSGSNPPLLTGVSWCTLRDTSSADLNAHQNCPSIGVDVNTTKTNLYVGIYNYNSGSVSTDTAKVYQYDFSNYASNWDALNEVDVTKESGTPRSTAIETERALGFGSGNFVAITVRYDDPENSLASSGHPLMVAFTRQMSGKADNYEVVYRFMRNNLSAFASNNPLTNSALEYRTLVNSTQSLTGTNAADIFLTTVSHFGFTTSGGSTTIHNTNRGSASFLYPTGSKQSYGIKEITTSSTSTVAAKEGLLVVAPPTVAPLSAEEAGASAVIYYKKGVGGVAPVFSIIEPGSGFTDAGTNTQTAFETAINAELGGSYTISVTFDEDNELLRTPEHEVFYINATRTAGGAPVSICKNASLISDSFREFSSTSLLTDATGVGLKTLVNVSRTNGNTGSFNSFNALIDTEGRLLACTPTGASSLNFASDYESIYRNNMKMFDGVSKVQTVLPSGYGKRSTNVIFGSNILVADGNTYTDSEDSSLASQVGSDQFYSVGVSELDPLPDRSLPGADIGSQFLVGGGVLCSYDGNTLVENGFYEHPEIRTLTAIATNFGSSLTASKTYSYSFVYEFIDSLNNIHESVTTPQVQVDTTADKTAICAKVYGCDVSLKRGSIRVTMYRTTPSGDGTLLKKVKTAILDESQRDFTFFDFGEVQDVFDSAPVIYTTGGILDNSQPGSITDITEHRGRVFLATPTEFVRFSKPVRQATAPGFPVPQFVIDVPGDSGDITGVESNSNFLCLFTRSSVFAVSGDGPNALGQGAFSQPVLLGNGQGLVPGSAHLSHAFGTFYATDRGVYLVTPNGGVEYVGAPVEDTIALGVVKSIDVFDHNNEIRFLVQPAITTSSSKICCFNTFYKQWSVWELGEHIVDQINYSETGASAEDSHYILSDDSPIRRQSATVYQDTTTPLDSGGSSASAYNMDVLFMPISINGIQGAQRVYRAMILYTAKDSGTVALSVRLAFDYKGFTEQHDLAAMPNAPENLRVHLSNQKCRAVQVRLLAVGTNSAITLNGLALEIGARPGTFKLPSAQTIAPS